MRSGPAARRRAASPRPRRRAAFPRPLDQSERRRDSSPPPPSMAPSRGYLNARTTPRHISRHAPPGGGTGIGGRPPHPPLHPISRNGTACTPRPSPSAFPPRSPPTQLLPQASKRSQWRVPALSTPTSGGSKTTLPISPPQPAPRQVAAAVADEAATAPTAAAAYHRGHRGRPFLPQTDGEGRGRRLVGRGEGRGGRAHPAHKECSTHVTVRRDTPPCSASLREGPQTERRGSGTWTPPWATPEK